MPTAASVLVDLDLPDFRDYAVEVEQPATVRRESTRAARQDAARHLSRATPRPANFRLFCPDETNSNRLGDVFEVENRCFVGRTLDIDDHVSPDGRVMEVLSEHLCEGWLEGYLLTGRHGLFATYEAFAMVSASMTVQHTKWLQEAIEPRLARAGRVAQHPAHLDLLAQRPQRLQPPGPRPDRRRCSPSGARVARIYLPPDANCLLSVADHCLRSRNYVNLIVIDKQPQLQCLDMETAHRALRARRVDLGLGQQRRRRRAGRGARLRRRHPDAGDGRGGVVLRQLVPDLRVRVVNVVDLMRLSRASITRTA